MTQQLNIRQTISTLQSIISNKKDQLIICSKATLDWKQAELALAEELKNQGMGIKLIEFQKQCLKNKISCFYSFFIMQKLILDNATEDLLITQTNNIQQQKSKYHQIKTFIKMRQHLLSKINQFTGSNIKSLFQDIDDIRFLNFQIIFLIDRWKNQWRVKNEIEPVFYQGNINYLLKINNDNVDMINLANFKKTKFISPPNPFFISEDGNLQGMSSKQKDDINICMEIINKERGIDLRMSVSGGIFVKKNQKGGKPKDKSISIAKRQASFGREKKQASFVIEAKNEMLSLKQQQIRKIYKINKSLQNTKTKASQQKIINVKIRKQSNEKKQTQKLKMYSRIQKKYSSQKLIKDAAIKQTNLIQAKLKNTVQIPKNTNSSIRAQIDKVVKQLQQTESPTKKREVRQMKPKIKLVQQKQSNVELPTKNVNVSFNPSASRSLARKNSTFYKKVEPIQEQTQDNQLPTQNIKKRALSQSNFYSIKSKKQQVEKDNKSIDVKNMQSSVISKKKQAQSQIRNLNNQIKNLTIINIYKSKKSIKKPKNSSFEEVRMEESTVAKNNAKSFITQIDNNQYKSDTSKLNLDLNRIKKQNENEISKISLQLSKKSIKAKKNQQILEMKQKKTLQAQKELQMKSIIISQLQQKIKSLQVKKTSHNKKQQVLNNHTKQYQRARKMKEIQSRILKDKIKSEEQKFIANRQMELKIKEEAIKKQFKNNIKTLEVQTIKKKKAFEKLMLQEERKFKQTQKLIIKEKNKHKEIQNQLEQKRLKQTLLKKIMEEKEQAISRQQQSEKDLQKILENQIKMRQKMQMESLELIEIEKKKMQQFYQQLIEKNKRIEEENQRKLQQLNKIDEQRNIQLQKLKQLQENYSTIIKNQQNHINVLQEPKDINEGENLQNLKLTLKQELLQEIIKKQQQESLQEQQQQQRRKRRLKKIEQEIAQTLKAEEDQLQKQNQQFLKKLEQIKEITIIPSTHQPQQKLQQNMQQISEIQKKEQIQSQNNEEMNIFELKPANSIVAENNIDEEIKKIQEIKQNKQKQPQILTKQNQSQNKVQILQQNKTNKEQDNQIQPKEQLKQISKKQKVSQAQNLLQKYKKVKQLTKKTKQLTIEDKNISKFIDSFILQLEKPIRQMLPFSKYDLEKIFSNKKVDIYEYNSIGWKDEKEKYNLIGGIQCIQNIVKKYGSVEIHQLFIFDKTNPYQKQALAKKMKVYQSIGFVYQKKLQESNKYSIRFVIKVPKEIGGQLKKSKPQIASKITIETVSQASKNPEYLYQCSISYLFSRILKQNMQKSQLEAYIEHPQHFNKTINKQLREGILKNTYKHMKIQEINDNIISNQLILPFKYFRTQQRAFYMAKFSQYQIQDSHFYVAYIEQGLAIVLQQTKAKNIPLDFVLFNTIETINSSSKMRETDVCLPIWSYNNTTVIEQDGFNLVYREKTMVEFSLGSVVSTFLLKHEYVQMRAPFIISYCEVGKQKNLIRPLSGHRVTEKDIIFNNLK